MRILEATQRKRAKAERLAVFSAFVRGPFCVFIGLLLPSISFSVDGCWQDSCQDSGKFGEADYIRLNFLFSFIHHPLILPNPLGHPQGYEFFSMC